MKEACYCDGESPRVYHRKTRTAAKDWRCEECGARIFRGDRYEEVRALYYGDDRWSIFRTCGACVDVRQFVIDSVPCFCWYHGHLLEDVMDTVNEYSHEAPGLWFGAVRRIKRAEKIAQRRSQANPDREK